jgi:hypothetical protein
MSDELDMGPLDYGLETVMTLPDGFELRCEPYESNDTGTSYVRIVDPDGDEVAYWTVDEWAREPQFVMGAIMGSLREHWPIQREPLGDPKWRLVRGDGAAWDVTAPVEGIVAAYDRMTDAVQEAIDELCDQHQRPRDDNDYREMVHEEAVEKITADFTRAEIEEEGFDAGAALVRLIYSGPNAGLGAPFTG